MNINTPYIFVNVMYIGETYNIWFLESVLYIHVQLLYLTTIKDARKLLKSEM